MSNKDLNEIKKDKDISPEDVARFALYENDMNDGDKYTAICDLVVACEESQTNPLKQQIVKLEAENKELREALEQIVNYSYEWKKQQHTVTLSDAFNTCIKIAEKSIEPGIYVDFSPLNKIAEQALKSK